MAQPEDLISHAACVLTVKNMQDSLKFYRDKLGFELTFGWNDPIDYAVLKRGGVQIHLTTGPETVAVENTNRSLYLFVHDVDKLYQEFKRKEVSPMSSPAERDYEMKDFDVKDPSGYILTFGKG